MYLGFIIGGVMAIYLEDVQDDFDKQELRYLELVDCFGVAGVYRRLRELRAAMNNKESDVVIKSKRRFIYDLDERDYGRAVNCQA